MLRIGIMLDSYVSVAWVAKIVEDLQTCGFARIELVILNTPPVKTKIELKSKLRKFWRTLLYGLYKEWDYRLNQAVNDAKVPVDLTTLLIGVPSIAVHPIRKGFTDRIPEDELDRIRGHNLDVLFRFGFRIIRGGILGAARYGVWSFHHGDNLEYRGGPPLFWEIYERNPVSGSMLQILTETLDGGRVIYRSHSSTHQVSLYRNRNPIYWKTAEFALRRLRDLHQRGFDYLASLPTYREPDTYTRGIYHTPTPAQMARFLVRVFSRGVTSQINRLRYRTIPQWFLAIRKRSEAPSDPQNFNDTRGYKLILPPKGRCYADPFLFEKNGETYLFFEDFSYAEGRAVISCLKLASECVPGTPVEVLRRPYHLSYPFLFEQNGEIYMIPETKENRTVELYRATNFPTGWSLEAVLLKDVYAVDATIHKAGDRFWMFVGISNGRYSNNDELGLYFADALTGPWTPHPSSPVVSDVRRARSAGALFRDGDRLIRPSQDCSRTYGYAVVFSEVVTLTDSEYEERPIARIDPHWLSGNLGTHTYNRTSKFEVIDGNFRAARWR